MIGYLGGRQSSTRYYQKRTGANYPDLGDFGDIFITNSREFNVTAGRMRQAFNSPPHAGVVDTSVFQDFVAHGQSLELSGVTAPDLSAVSVGQSVADGALQLTRLDGALYLSESIFYPCLDDAVNGGQPNRNFNGWQGERMAGRGYDPLGIIASTYRVAMRASPAELKIVWAG